MAAGLFSYLFVEIGRLSGGKPIKFMFPKYHKIFNIFVAFANFSIFAAMLAGAGYILKSSIGVYGGAIIAGLASLAIVSGGHEKIKKLNLAAVPFIIIVVAILFISKPSAEFSGEVKVVSPLLYAAMNALTGGFLAAKMSGETDERDGFYIGATVTVVLTALITLVYLASKNYADEEMPLLSLAKSVGLSPLAYALIFTAVMTALSGVHSSLSSYGKNSAVIFLALGLAASVFGFKTIVDHTYPVIGIVGAAACLAALIRVSVLKIKRRNVII
jgi:Uncharacterized membrane protein